MADCLNCKNCIRFEVYDGQWGMFKFDKRCSANVSVIKDGRLNPWDMECNQFECGNPTIANMTDREKQEYDKYYIPKSENKDLKEINKILLEDNLDNIESRLKILGIKIRKWNGKYKSCYKVFKEIHKKWSKTI